MTIVTDSDNTANSPFHKRNDLEDFFVGGGRGEVVDQLQEAILTDVPLLVLTGEKGSGKSMICEMLEKRVAEECTVVCFPRTVESFEDVIRLVAQTLGVVAAGITDGQESKDTIRKIAQILLEEGRHLLIILQEAENIFLATLERIRRMLGRMTEEEVHFHVVFSGKPSFLENYEQLLICDFKKIEEIYLSLYPLSQVETSDYLKTCKDRLQDTVQKNLLSEEIIEKIAEVAEGNFKMVNTLAEEVIAPSDNDSGLEGGLGKFTGDKEGAGTGWKWPQPEIDIKRFLPMLPWAGGVFCIIFVVFLMWGPGDEKETDLVPPPMKPAEERQVTVIKKETIAPPESVGKKPVVVDKKPVVAVAKPVEIKKIQSLISEEPVVPAEVKKLQIPVKKEKVTDDEVVPRSTIAQEEQKEIKPQEEVVVELRQFPPLKRKASMPELPAVKSIAEVVPPKKAPFSTDQLYAERIAAGRGWKYGAKDTMYTIQLMALTSKNAEANLKEMLAKDSYRKEAQNFFIFKKKGYPTIIMVYYGEYRTIAAARNMRKIIPPFLQKHKPYAISIKGAVAKVKK